MQRLHCLQKMFFMVTKMYYQPSKCTAPAVFICYSCPFFPPHNRKSQANNFMHIVNVVFKHWLVCSTVGVEDVELCQETHRNELLIKVAWCNSGSRQAFIANRKKRKCSKAWLKDTTCATGTNPAIQPCSSNTLWGQNQHKWTMCKTPSILLHKQLLLFFTSCVNKTPLCANDWKIYCAILILFQIFSK